MDDVILSILLVIVVLATKMLSFLDPVHNYGSGGFAVTKVVGSGPVTWHRNLYSNYCQILCIQEAQCATLSLPFLDSDVSFSIKSTFILTGSCQLK